MWSIFSSVQLGFHRLFSLYAGIKVFVGEISVNNVSLGNSIQLSNLGFFNKCKYFFQWFVVHRNAGQMKIRLVTLEERAVRGKYKNLGQWPRKGIGGEKMGWQHQIVKFGSWF